MKRALAVMCGLLAAARVEAQEPTPFVLSGTVSGFFARQAVASQEELDGGWIGAGLDGKWRGVSLVVRGYSGTVGSGIEARRMRLTDAVMRVRVRPWLWVGLEGDALWSAEPGDTSVWRMAGPSAAVSASLGVDGLTVGGEAAYFPILGVAGLDPLAHAARLEVGMDYAPAQLPLGFGLAFRRQTFSFSDDRASESLGGLVLSVRARLFSE